jgi:hypothetical protein
MLKPRQGRRKDSRWALARTRQAPGARPHVPLAAPPAREPHVHPRRANPTYLSLRPQRANPTYIPSARTPRTSPAREPHVHPQRANPTYIPSARTPRTSPARAPTCGPRRVPLCGPRRVPLCGPRRVPLCGPRRVPPRCAPADGGAEALPSDSYPAATCFTKPSTRLTELSGTRCHVRRAPSGPPHHLTARGKSVMPPPT